MTTEETASADVHGGELDGVQGVGFVLLFDRRGHHAKMEPRVGVVE